MSDKHQQLPPFLGRLLCMIGLHNFRITNVTFGFGSGDSVEKVECRRCGAVATRPAKD